MAWSIAVGALAVAAAFIAICLYFPARMTSNRTFPDASFDATDNTRKTIAQILGGAALILTFAWSFLKDSETLEQARQQEANQEYIAAARLLTETGNAATRAAGVYALGRVAATRSEYHMPVRDTLVAFVRHWSDSKRDPASRTVDPALGPSRIGADLQAVIEVVGRRNVRADDPARLLWLNQLYLVGGSFYRLTAFRGASFQGAALYGTDFRESDLSSAKFDGADFSDWQGYGVARWTDEVAHRGQWDQWEKFRYIANFDGARLVGTTFTGAGLSGARFSNADLSGTDFSRANLSRADFRQARNIARAIFRDSGGSACADDPALFDSTAKIVLPRCR